MSKGSYNWVTNVALVLGVLSAFLYDWARVPHAFAIGLAIIAGVMSVGAYFYNRFSCDKASKADVETASPCQEIVVVGPDGTEAIDMRLHGKLRPSRLEIIGTEGIVEEIKLAEYRVAMQKTLVERIRDLTSLLEAQRKASAERTAAYMQQYLLESNAARRMRYRFPAETRLMEPEVEMSPKEAAECYRQIILGLAGEDRIADWEFVIDANGLRVRGKKYQPDIFEVDIHELLIAEVDMEGDGIDITDARIF
jgi:hypothetical protein